MAAQHNGPTTNFSRYLTFLPGESSKSFEVPIVDDFYSEGDETLKAF